MFEDTGVDVETVQGVIDVLGKLKVHELELYASIHLIGGPKSGRAMDDTLATVGRVKPGFTANQVERAFQELQEAELI